MMPSDIGCEMERESDYPYTAMDGKCKFNRSKVVTKVSKFVKVPKKREDQLKLSVAQVGPVSVAIDAASSGFMLYKKGIYQDNTCSEDYLDHAVLVVGYDADKTRQNRPRVTVVAAIELEHTDFLGDTIREVAWNKAGIFKPGVAAVVATDEPEDAMAVFTEEAEAVQCPLFVAPRFVDVQRSLGGDDVVLSDWQRLVHEMGCPLVNERNVCLALAAVSLWHGHYSTVSPSVQLDPSMLASKDVPTLCPCPTRKQIDGILSTRVVGRFHEVQMSKKLTFYVDCAHTAESIRAPYIAHFAVHCNWKSQSTGYAETAGGEV
ncbi:Cathepsin L [Echinococcus granulosus]|nr:Cathepsin L [Echinococcus granulosus]